MKKYIILLSLLNICNAISSQIIQPPIEIPPLKETYSLYDGVNFTDHIRYYTRGSDNQEHFVNFKVSGVPLVVTFSFSSLRADGDGVIELNGGYEHSMLKTNFFMTTFRQNDKSIDSKTVTLEPGDYHIKIGTTGGLLLPRISVIGASIISTNVNVDCISLFKSSEAPLTALKMSKSQNAVVSITPREAISAIEFYENDGFLYFPNNIKGKHNSDILVQYFDGLGRPTQTVQTGVTPNGSDLVSLQEYDGFGRDAESWLPGYLVTDNKGAYVAPATVKARAKASNLNDAKPYSNPIYEASPLNRVVEQYGPGEDWHNKSKSVKTYYLTNKGGGAVAKTKTMDDKDTQKGILSGVYSACDLITLKPGFQFKSTEEKSLHLYTDPSLCQAPKTEARSTSSMPTLRDEFLMCTNYQIKNEQLSKNNSYNAGELYVTLMLDEDDNKSLEFKDKLGQVVLTRQINGAEKYDTYYVYDDFGNLRYVLPPLAVDKVTNYKDDNELMKQYAYIYKYDDCNRCTQKKIPGIEPVLYIYDKANQLIFTQDGVQKPKGEWTFTLNDALGRNTLTGTIINPTIKYGMWNNIATAPIVKANYDGGTINMGYKISGYSFNPTQIYAVNYYDNYNFLSNNNIPIPNNANGQYTTEIDYGVAYGTHSDNVKSKGLLTGTLTAQMSSTTIGNYLYSVMYYDNRGRIIQTKSNNHLAGGLEKEYIAYNFTGQPIKKMHVHIATGKTTQTEVYTYSYDHAGRLLDTKHKLNTGAETLIASNKYDELGRLKENKKGGKTDKLKTTYAYNVRSWTKTIASPIFTQELYYNTSFVNNSPRFGGDITAMSWKHADEATARTYSFKYDELSRLKHAAYNNVASGGRYNSSYAYDKHGNITQLVRNGEKTLNSFVPVDNLAMSYNGNQLINVKDAVKGASMAGSADFQDEAKDNGKNTYNFNGALASDSHKGISSIQYNSLNLPTAIEIANSKHKGRIEYTYSASGAKLRTVHKDNSELRSMSIMGVSTYATSGENITTTDYVGNKVYENGVLKRTLVDGGYIEANQYYFYLTDHLGNNRAVAKDNGEVIQKTHYYPFGMEFADATEKKGDQPYKYNGKELDKRMGLNTYDYSARYMDPAIGRFTSVDPHAENYYSISPYVYTANNPLKHIDPDGKDYTIYFDRDKKGNLTGLRIEAKVYITGSNASKERAGELNKLAKSKYTSQSVGGVKVSFNVNYEYKKNISSENLGLGENILDFNDKTTKSWDRSHIKARGEGMTGNTGEIYSDADNNTVMHETGHFLGLSDRYSDADAGNIAPNLKAVIHKGYGNDIMSGGGANKTLQKSHYQYYIDAFGSSRYISTGHGKVMIDYDQKAKKLRTPHEAGGYHIMEWYERIPKR